MSQTYSDVDSSGDPSGAVAWQQDMATWPAITRYKQRTYDLLADARLVLDIGCGPGADLVGLGPGRSVGIDRSSTMCSTAARNGSAVARADADELPFRAATFQGVRADRVFQHLTDPESGLREIVRVLAPDGRLLIADPDQESLVIQVPGVRPSVLDRLKRARRDTGYRNGRLVSRLPSLCHEQGLQEIAVDAYPLAIDDPAKAFGITSWPDLWHEECGFTDAELDEWHTAVRTPTGGFLYLVTILVVTAAKPFIRS